MEIIQFLTEQDANQTSMSRVATFFDSQENVLEVYLIQFTTIIS